MRRYSLTRCLQTRPVGWIPFERIFQVLTARGRGENYLDYRGRSVLANRSR